jgi:hypothetical protein
MSKTRVIQHRTKDRPYQFIYNFEMVKSLTIIYNNFPQKSILIFIFFHTYDNPTKTVDKNAKKWRDFLDIIKNT